MALLFERIRTDAIAQLSYLVGDDSEGVAAVFDPRPDVDGYLELARDKKVSITHILETHIHVDSLSGARELCARVESAKLLLSHEGGARYGFEHEPIVDGEDFFFGSVSVSVRQAPGYTPELGHELKDAKSKLQVLDVRSPDEWKSGHIPNASHIQEEESA